jgi:hypothetical protein
VQIVKREKSARFPITFYVIVYGRIFPIQILNFIERFIFIQISFPKSILEFFIADKKQPKFIQRLAGFQMHEHQGNVIINVAYGFLHLVIGIVS